MNITRSRKIPLSSIFIITMILMISSVIPLKDAKSSVENTSTKDKGNTENTSTKDESSAESKSTKDEILVKITKSISFLDVNHNGKIIRIQRVQDQDYKVTNSYAKTSRPCPPFCIRPIQLPNNIKTVGELEVLNFLKNKVQQDKGILIDARLEDWNVKGTIPGAVNIPFTMFRGGLGDIDTVHLLELLGVEEDEENDKWVFDNAIELMLFCNGPWCGQSQKAIKHLLTLGYPAEKLYWYRGGMQAWQSFGLTVIKP